MSVYYDDYENINTLYEFPDQEDMYEEVRGFLAPEYRDLAPEDIEAIVWEAGISAEDLEFFSKALKSIGRFAKKVAPRALPVIGTTLGTVVGGPVGAMAGGALGRLAGGALGGSSRPRRRRRISGARRRPHRRMQRRAPVNRVARGRGVASRDLLMAISNPTVQRALMSGMLGRFGQQNVTIGNRQVPIGAITNMLGVLANRASVEMNEQSNSQQEFPAYLLNSTGEFLVDPAEAEQRAELVFELLAVDEANYVEYEDELETLELLSELYEVIDDDIAYEEEYIQ